MRIHKMQLTEITFDYHSYEQELYDSIQRIGLSFPIKLRVIANGYECIDGHKRLSVLQDLYGHSEDVDVYCLIMNDGSSRSNDCWRSRNTH